MSRVFWLPDHQLDVLEHSTRTENGMFSQSVSGTYRFSCFSFQLHFRPMLSAYLLTSIWTNSSRPFVGPIAALII